MDVHHLAPTLTTITANTNTTNSSGDNISQFSNNENLQNLATNSRNRDRGSHGDSSSLNNKKYVYFQCGLIRHMFDIEDVSTMSSLHVKGSIFLTNIYPELAPNFPTLSSCLTICKENYEKIINNKNSSTSSNSNDNLKKNSKNQNNNSPNINDIGRWKIM